LKALSAQEEEEEEEEEGSNQNINGFGIKIDLLAQCLLWYCIL
jgi:hypothetical protein